MNQYKRVAFYTLGCKLNFSESSSIGRQFTEAGYAKVDWEDRPDIFVVNTCSVTDHADKKCKQLVRKAKQINPDSFVVIIGCYAQLKPEEIASIEGVNMVLGANEKFNIIEHIEQNFDKETPYISKESIKEVRDFVPAFSLGDRTRSFLKIQDGCDYFCSFCTIPLARGKSRNATIAETVGEAEKIAQNNIKEVVLTGVNIGDFGQGSDENFYQLTQELDLVKGIERYRISSIEPNLLSDEIIHFCLTKSRSFVPHFHIPLQSGSDHILKAMRRKYVRSVFSDRVLKIKEFSPDACIGVDVIVGFPGESDADFNETLEFLKSLPISYLHVFTYSERANTGALKMDEPVPMAIRKDRNRMLQVLSDKLKRAFYESQLGQIRTVLFEQEAHEEFIYGFSDNYLRVKVPFDQKLINQCVSVEMKSIDVEGTILGRLKQ